MTVRGLRRAKAEEWRDRHRWEAGPSLLASLLRAAVVA